jgi:adenosylhomocysteine nucleosidase
MIVAGEKFELEHVRSREGVTFVKVTNGPGPRRASEGMNRVGQQIDAIVSAGLCGAVDPQLRIGTILVATEINGEPVVRPQCRGDYHVGPVASADRVIGTVAERRLLASKGIRGVDMESAAVLEKARALGVPFYCVRAVSDTADEDWTLDLNAARDTDGTFRVGRILAQAARRPVKIVPELLRLRRNAGIAARRLGEFFADCDF